MLRVLRPGGRLAVAVCDAVEHSPGYAALAAMLDRLFGATVGDAFRAPFRMGDTGQILALAHEAGLPDPDVLRRQGQVRFRSIDALVATERACVWTLGGMLDDAKFAALLQEARRALEPFVAADGSVAFDMPALLLTAGKPAGRGD
jgi:hypothetical protein